MTWLVLADDNERVRFRQELRETARNPRIFVNAFLTWMQLFAWRPHEVGTLEYEVQVDGVRLYPAAGTDLRAMERYDGQEPRSMSATVVAESLKRVRSYLIMVRRACEGDDALPEQTAYHIQQAAEKLTKEALVAIQKRPRKGDQIGAFAKRLRSSVPARARFLALDRFPNCVRAPRHPGEEGDLPPPPVPSVTEAHAWIAEVEALKTDFERWLAGRETRS